MKYIFISEYAHQNLKAFISSLNKNIIEIKRTAHVYAEISDHPDIYLCVMNNNIVIAKEQIIQIASDLGFYEKKSAALDLSPYHVEDYLQYLNEILSPIKVFAGHKNIGNKYPGSCIFNCVQLGDYFFHNVAYTDPTIMNIVNNSDYKIINVMQGYTNCNMVAVNESSIITSDPGIAKAILNTSNEIDVLLISEGNVILKGFPHGFLGGTCGRIDNFLIFNGNLAAHPDFEAIKTFVESKNLKLKYFEEYPLTDIGSIIGI